MIFKSLQNLIESCDESQFYDVALHFLEAIGYKNPAIVDGPYDGGRDVVSDRTDLRIQLSVQKKWEQKVEREAATTLANDRRSFIYICNRRISQVAREKFFKSYKLAGKVDVTIYDSQAIASRLSLPGRLGKAYKLLGVEVKPSLQATPKDVAISSVLLFGAEAQDLREQVVRANIASWLRSHSPAVEQYAIEQISRQIPGAGANQLVERAISRMRTAGEISGPPTSMSLSADVADRIGVAELQMEASREVDVQRLAKTLRLGEEEAENLLDLAIAAIIRSSSSGWSYARVDEFNQFISDKNLVKDRDVLNSIIADLDTISYLQKIRILDKLFAANTFDIHAALGAKDEVKIVLDASVALPMVCSLEFSATRSRWSAAATSLLQLADAHKFPVILPYPYLNEMAAHGLKAFEFQDVYAAFSPELKRVMRESRNAFISHYARIVDSEGNFDGETLTLKEFLENFGIRENIAVRRVENSIEGILERYGIACVWGNYYDDKIRREFEYAKGKSDPKLIDHDAAVCTSLMKQRDTGFILATWDNVVIELVQEKARIYADSPGRIVDWLSFVQGIDDDIGGSLEAYEALLHVEEAAIRKLASKLDRIENAEQAFRLTQIINEARKSKGADWKPTIHELGDLIETPLDEMAGGAESVGIGLDDVEGVDP